jgi:hypothetical protein
MQAQAPPRAGARGGAASSLTLPNRNHSGDPEPQAAGVGRVRAFSGPMGAGWRPGITRKQPPGNTRCRAALSTFNRSQPPPKTDSHAVDAVFEGHGEGTGVFEFPILPNSLVDSRNLSGPTNNFNGQGHTAWAVGPFGAGATTAFNKGQTSQVGRRGPFGWPPVRHPAFQVRPGRHLALSENLTPRRWTSGLCASRKLLDFRARC